MASAILGCLEGLIMALKAYSAVIKVGNEILIAMLPLSSDEYLEWLNCEFNATRYVLDQLRKNKMLSELTFTERDITLVPHR